MPVEDLNSEMKYDPVKAYSKTKLENVLFARELQRGAGSRLLSATCHPGYARTNLQFGEEALILKMAAAVLLPFSQNSVGGAQPTLFAATSPDAKPAAYYGPSGLFGLSGPVKETKMAHSLMTMPPRSLCLIVWRNLPTSTMHFSYNFLMVRCCRP